MHICLWGLVLHHISNSGGLNFYVSAPVFHVTILPPSTVNIKLRLAASSSVAHLPNAWFPDRGDSTDELGSLAKFVRQGQDNASKMDPKRGEAGLEIKD